MAGRFYGLLLEDKRPLRAKLHTAHMLRQQKFWNARPRLVLLQKPQDTRPEWQTPRLIETVLNPVRRIQHVVCEAYGVSMGQLLGVERIANIVRPRQVAMYLSRTLTSCSMPDLARRFGGRDHTTVMHAVRKIEQLYREDEELRRRINFIKGSLDVAVDGRRDTGWQVESPGRRTAAG